MTRPKVSVCIPAYNAPDLLRNSLQSVSEQTFKDFEVVITDDSTNDLSRQVAEEYKTIIPSLYYFKNEETKGSPENWNEAVRRARGEYIKILHQDDWFANENALERYVTLLETHPEADFAFSASGNFYMGSLAAVHRASAGQLSRIRKDYRNLYPDNYVGAPSATIYRKKVNQLYDVRMKITVDIDFYMRVLKANPNFVYWDERLVNTTAGAPHQQTTLYQHTKQGGLIEWLYVYDKINDNWWFRIRTFKFINFLFKEFCVESISDLDGFRPNPKALIVFNVVIRIQKIFRKIGFFSKV